MMAMLERIAIGVEAQRQPQGVVEAMPVSVPSAVPLSQDLGHSAPRPKTAADKVREHLLLYPDDKNVSVRELADKIGVGKSTVQRVLAE